MKRAQACVETATCVMRKRNAGEKRRGSPKKNVDEPRKEMQREPGWLR